MTAIQALAGVVIESRTSDQWAQTIRADLGQAVAGFIAAGQHLAQAKDELGLKGYEWESWLRDEIDISQSTGSMLMAIGRYEPFKIIDTSMILPPQWAPLYELTRLPESDFSEAVQAGAVRRELDRAEAKAIVSSYAARAAMPEIRHGDFRRVLADLRNVKLVVTDPPYGVEAVSLYQDLAQWAATALESGGSLVAYCGQATLPDVLAVMREHLRYWWTFCVEHHHGGQQLPGKHVIAEWKPAVWFVRERRSSTTYVADRIRGTRPDKDAHAWAQGSAEVLYLIEQLTEPGDLVADPFAGSGSFGKAALSAGRKFVGADLPGMVSS